jgi:DHA2 family multidrug resistance protein
VRALPAPFNLQSPVGPALLDAEVMRQASMIAYVDAFYLTAILSICSVPLLLLMRRPRRAAGPQEQTHAVME